MTNEKTIQTQRNFPLYWCKYSCWWWLLQNWFPQHKHQHWLLQRPQHSASRLSLYASSHQRHRPLKGRRPRSRGQTQLSSFFSPSKYLPCKSDAIFREWLFSYFLSYNIIKLYVIIVLTDLLTIAKNPIKLFSGFRKRKIPIWLSRHHRNWLDCWSPATEPSNRPRSIPGRGYGQLKYAAQFLNPMHWTIWAILFIYLRQISFRVSYKICTECAIRHNFCRETSIILDLLICRSGRISDYCLLVFIFASCGKFHSPINCRTLIRTFCPCPDRTVLWL